jgi:hypothetical protein
LIGFFRASNGPALRYPGLRTRAAGRRERRGNRLPLLCPGFQPRADGDEQPADTREVSQMTGRGLDRLLAQFAQSGLVTRNQILVQVRMRSQHQHRPLTASADAYAPISQTRERHFGGVMGVGDACCQAVQQVETPRRDGQGPATDAFFVEDDTDAASDGLKPADPLHSPDHGERPRLVTSYVHPRTHVLLSQEGRRT